MYDAAFNFTKNMFAASN